MDEGMYWYINNFSFGEW